MIRRPPRSTLFPYTTALPISPRRSRDLRPDVLRRRATHAGNRYSHGARRGPRSHDERSEEHTSELQSPDHLVCRLLLEKKKSRNRILTPSSYTLTCAYRAHHR